MADVLLTDSLITRESLRLFKNNLVLGNKMNRDHVKEYTSRDAKPGSTIQIRRPVQWTTRTGATASPQDVVETSVSLAAVQRFGVDFDFSDTDLALSIDRFSDRYLKTAMSDLAAKVDNFIYSEIYKQVWNQVGTPGVSPASDAVVLDSGVKLDDGACPRDDERCLILSPRGMASLVAGLGGRFQSAERISEQYKSGMMGQALGYNFYMSQSVASHTAGPQGGTPLVNGASQGNAGTNNAYVATTSLVTDGWTAAAANRLNKGDVVTLAGVFSVNPKHKGSTGVLQDFVVTADAASDASGNLTAVLSPAIITGGAYQNVTGFAADNAAIVVKSGAANAVSPVNLAFHPHAFTLVPIKLDVPNGTDMASQMSGDGMSMRFIRDYNSSSDVRLSRFDVQFGFVAQRPEWACRVWG